MAYIATRTTTTREYAVWTTGGDVPNAASELRRLLGTSGRSPESEGCPHQRVKPRDSLRASGHSSGTGTTSPTTAKSSGRSPAAACRVRARQRRCCTSRPGQQSAFVVTTRRESRRRALPPERQTTGLFRPWRRRSCDRERATSRPNTTQPRKDPRDLHSASVKCIIIW